MSELTINDKRKKLKFLYGGYAKKWMSKVNKMSSNQVYAVYERMERDGYFNPKTKNGHKVEQIKQNEAEAYQYDMWDLGLIKEDGNMMDKDRIFIEKDNDIVVQHIVRLSSAVGDVMAYLSNLSTTGTEYTKGEAKKALDKLNPIYYELVKYDPKK